MHPKSFYHSYHASNELFEIDRLLIQQVLSVNPTSIFDFGCGTGKILAKIQDINQAITLCGLDMSFINIIHARAQNNLPFVCIGDEYHLPFFRQFDVAMTCSVLCHIENIEDIVRDLKVLANAAIFIAETRDVIGEFYYDHDYIALGFEDTGIEWKSTTGANYKIYKLTV